MSGLASFGEAFAQSEEERGVLRSKLDQLNCKPLSFSACTVFPSLLMRLEYFSLLFLGEKSTLESRLAELEKTLSQQLAAQEELDVLRVSEGERVKRLLGYAHSPAGKDNMCPVRGFAFATQVLFQSS